MAKIINIIIIVLQLIYKILRDLATTLYDDFDFQFMSLPRVGLGVSIFMVFVSWIAQQFYGYKFEYFPQLVQLVIALVAGYVGKKIVERGKDNGQNSSGSGS